MGKCVSQRMLSSYITPFMYKEMYRNQKGEISQILGVERNTIMYFVDIKGSKPHPRRLGTAKPV